MQVRYHKEAAQGKWFELSIMEQLAHIGSEVSRAKNWKDKDPALFQGAVERALELFDLTCEDPRWRAQKRLQEIALARELFCDAISGGKEYSASLEELNRYFLPYALAARKNV
jgi:hypothetical protein